MTALDRIESLEGSRVKFGERIGNLEHQMIRMTLYSAAMAAIVSLVGNAIILTILARLGKLI